MRTNHLALVRLPPEDRTSEEERDVARPGRPDEAELWLVVLLLSLSLVPVVGELVHPGAWSPAMVALAALASVLLGRELWSQLRGRRSARIDP